MGTSIGSVIDHLVNLFTHGYDGQDLYEQPLTVPPLTAINRKVEVADTRPTKSGGVWVIVGRQSVEQESEITAQAAYQVLGRQRISESYTLPGHVLVYGPGPDPKPVRDTAIALFDGVVKLIWADPTLGGVLQDGRIGMVSEFSFGQPDPDTGDQVSSGAALAAVVTFGIQIENSYIP